MSWTRPLPRALAAGARAARAGVARELALVVALLLVRARLATLAGDIALLLVIHARETAVVAAVAAALVTLARVAPALSLSLVGGHEDLLSVPAAHLAALPSPCTWWHAIALNGHGSDVSIA